MLRTPPPAPFRTPPAAGSRVWSSRSKPPRSKICTSRPVFLFLESRYKNFFTFQGSTLTDASGNEFYRTPKFTGTIAATYTIPLEENGLITLDTDWSYRSHIYHNAVVQNDPVQETPGYGIGNARISYLTPNGKFEFAVYSNNILDQSWKILAQVPNNGAYPVSLGQPRTTGASVQIRF